MLLTPPAFVLSNQNTTIKDTLTNIALTSGLVLCLDAGDGSSYDGTSQTWSDVSGNGYNFFRGGGSGSDAADPTFHGTADARSSNEYFVSDGDDAFLATAAHTYSNGWHKDNATFSVVSWSYIPTGATKTVELQRRYRDLTDVGSAVFLSVPSSTGKMAVSQVNGAAQQTLSGPTSNVITSDQWTMTGLSFSEGSGASFVRCNGTAELLSSDTYTSPSATTATNRPVIWGTPDAAGTGLDANTAARPSSGTRINCLMAWSRAITQTEMTALYNATKGKFGL